MNATVANLTGQEVLRFLRRRETFWTLLGVQAALWVLAFLGLLGFEDVGSEMVDLGRNFTVSVEAVCLFVLAIHSGLRTVRQELDSGSWILLAQTPNPTGRLWAGKLLGTAACLLATHCFLSLPILAFTPLLRRSHGDVAVLFLGVLVYAAAVVPEGMVYGLVGRRWPRLVYLLYVATVIRIVLPVPFLLAAVRPDSLGERPGLPAVVAGLLPLPAFSGSSLRAPETFAYPWLPVAVVLGVQLASAFPYWLALSRTRR